MKPDCLIFEWLLFQYYMQTHEYVKVFSISFLCERGKRTFVNFISHKKYQRSERNKLFGMCVWKKHPFFIYFSFLCKAKVK